MSIPQFIIIEKNDAECIKEEIPASLDMTSAESLSEAETIVTEKCKKDSKSSFVIYRYVESSIATIEINVVFDQRDAIPFTE
jgi:hypothetical protein